MIYEANYLTQDVDVIVDSDISEAPTCFSISQ